MNPDRSLTVVSRDGARAMPAAGTKQPGVSTNYPSPLGPGTGERLHASYEGAYQGAHDAAKALGGSGALQTPIPHTGGSGEIAEEALFMATSPGHEHGYAAAMNEIAKLHADAARREADRASNAAHLAQETSDRLERRFEAIEQRIDSKLDNVLEETKSLAAGMTDLRFKVLEQINDSHKWVVGTGIGIVVLIVAIVGLVFKH